MSIKDIVNSLDIISSQEAKKQKEQSERELKFIHLTERITYFSDIIEKVFPTILDQSIEKKKPLIQIEKNTVEERNKLERSVEINELTEQKIIEKRTGNGDIHEMISTKENSKEIPLFMSVPSLRISDNETEQNFLQISLNSSSDVNQLKEEGYCSFVEKKEEPKEVIEEEENENTNEIENEENGNESNNEIDKDDKDEESEKEKEIINQCLDKIEIILQFDFDSLNPIPDETLIVELYNQIESLLSDINEYSSQIKN